METTITVRHTNIPEDLKERARDLIGRLANRAHRPHGADVVFDVKHQTPTVELKLHLPRSQVVVASADAEDHRTALDRVVDKARSQLERMTPSPARR